MVAAYFLFHLCSLISSIRVHCLNANIRYGSHLKVDVHRKSKIRLIKNNKVDSTVHRCPGLKTCCCTTLENHQSFCRHKSLRLDCNSPSYRLDVDVVLIYVVWSSATLTSYSITQDGSQSIRETNKKCVDAVWIFLLLLRAY